MPANFREAHKHDNDRPAHPRPINCSAGAAIFKTSVPTEFETAHRAVTAPGQVQYDRPTTAPGVVGGGGGEQYYHVQQTEPPIVVLPEEMVVSEIVRGGDPEEENSGPSSSSAQPS